MHEVAVKQMKEKSSSTPATPAAIEEKIKSNLI